MKYLLFILFAFVSLAQTHVVGDTTDLKNYPGSNAVLLERFGGGDLTGGGLFIRIDSTYSEGKDAFDYSTAEGLQWARIQYPTFAELYISTNDTITLTNDSTYYTINGFSSGNIVGLAVTDSSVNLNTYGYYEIEANISFEASDTAKYVFILDNDGTVDSNAMAIRELVANDTTMQSISIGGVIYSGGNTTVKLKVKVETDTYADEIIIYAANIRFKKIN